MKDMTMASPEVIFINGASSSGKSTLAKALQNQLDKPYIYFAEDMFFDGLPAREIEQAAFMRYGYRLYDGFTQCVRTMVKCENRVIVDTVAWSLGSLSGFVNAIWDLHVFAIGVFCDMNVLEAREHDRRDRSVGLARRQYELVHQNALYDIKVDTTNASIDVCVANILEAMQNRQTPHAFAKMKQQLVDEQALKTKSHV